MNASFINSAEAAFIAEVSDRDVNRVIDEHIVPDSLIQLGSGRRIARLAAAFISFYFKTESLFSAQLRKRILSTIAGRVSATDKWENALALTFVQADFDKSRHFFKFVAEEHAELTLDISRYVADASARARLVDHALEQISVDESVVGGVPVFKGTRVPIDAVLASLSAGVDVDRLRESYPFLTPESIEAARIYAMVRPRRGRPRRLADANPTWKLKSREVVRSPGTTS
jgi:uncharacterized protein (DUF433 family)